MHARILHYLSEVARQGSFRKAGDVLNVTPSALNRQVRNLEETFGVRLFDRRSDGVELTHAGHVILDYAQETLASYERARARVLAIRDIRSGAITVSSINSLAFRLLPEIVRKFSKKYPDVVFTIRDDPAEEVLQSIEDNSVDVGLTFSYFGHPGARLITEVPARFGAVVSVDHPLAGKPSATLEECLAFPIIRTFDPKGKHMFVEDEARKIGLTVAPCFYTNSMVMAINAIKMGIGVGVYMKYGVMDEIENGTVSFVPISDTNLLEFRVGLFISARKPLNETGNEFVRNAKETFSIYS